MTKKGKGRERREREKREREEREGGLTLYSGSARASLSAKSSACEVSECRKVSADRQKTTAERKGDEREREREEKGAVPPFRCYFCRFFPQVRKKF
jgi:hypothetical protein